MKYVTKIQINVNKTKHCWSFQKIAQFPAWKLKKIRCIYPVFFLYWSLFHFIICFHKKIKDSILSTKSECHLGKIKSNAIILSISSSPPILIWSSIDSCFQSELDRDYFQAFLASLKMWLLRNTIPPYDVSWTTEART